MSDLFYLLLGFLMLYFLVQSRWPELLLTLGLTILGWVVGTIKNYLAEQPA